MPAKVIDITGQKFGMLTVIRENGYNDKGIILWLCKCDCGGEKNAIGGNLRAGTLISCGCLRGKDNGKTIHGKRSAPEYDVWRGMRKRCNNPHDRGYHNYGGRGIRVCKRWMESFENFLDDMGPRPTSKHSIDRIDVNGNYEPDNCRWATPDIQAKNRRPRKYSAKRGGGNMPDISNMRFGKWLVIERAGSDKHQNALWLCQCDCGTISKIVAASLRTGHSTRCRSCADKNL